MPCFICPKGFAGTPGYLSPEVLRKDPYGKPVDIWACGESWASRASARYRLQTLLDQVLGAGCNTFRFSARGDSLYLAGGISSILG